MSLTSPYRGLAAFDDTELDALYFFGRERDCRDRSREPGRLPADRALRRRAASASPRSLRAGVARALRALPGEPLGRRRSRAGASDPAATLAADGRRRPPASSPAPSSSRRAGAGRARRLPRPRPGRGVLQSTTATADGFERELAELIHGPLRVERPPLAPGGRARLARPASRARIPGALRELPPARSARPRRRAGGDRGAARALTRARRGDGRDRARARRARARRGRRGADRARRSAAVGAVDAQRVAHADRGAVPAARDGAAVGRRAGGWLDDAPRLATLERSAAQPDRRRPPRAGAGGAPPASRTVAAALFAHLVTPRGRRSPTGLRPRGVRSRPESEVRPVLATLVGRRIVPPDEARRWEIFHDVLAGAVLGWRRRSRGRAGGRARAGRGAAPPSAARGARVGGAGGARGRRRSRSGRSSSGATPRSRPRARGPGARRERAVSLLDDRSRARGAARARGRAARSRRARRRTCSAEALQGRALAAVDPARRIRAGR